MLAFRKFEMVIN